MQEFNSVNSCVWKDVIARIQFFKLLKYKAVSRHLERNKIVQKEKIKQKKNSTYLMFFQTKPKRL